MHYSSLTDSLKKLSYNYGLTVGRSVYRLFDEKKHYRWYGDSIQDLCASSRSWVTIT